MFLSAKVAAISPSPTLEITAKANKLKSEGVDILGFGAGEPDFDTPQHIKDAAASAMREGFTKYTPSAGTPALRKAVAEKLRRDNNLSYAPSQIVISCGAKHSLFNVILALFEDGDEVVLPAPYWVTYPEQIKLAGAVPVIADSRAENNFCLTPEGLLEKITPRTRGIILNSPNNPSGAVYDLKALKELTDIAVDRGLWIISDECYEHFIYDDRKHYSVAALGEECKARTIVINAVSKTYSMTGWRIGYAAGPREIMDAVANLQSQSTSNPCSISQKAALAALQGPQDFLIQWRDEFARRREMMVEGLNDIPNISCQNPGGAFYVFPNWGQLKGWRTPRGTLLETSYQIAEYFLEAARVAAVPGGAFGANDYLRISYVTSPAVIQEGLRRLSEAVGKLLPA